MLSGINFDRISIAKLKGATIGKPQALTAYEQYIYFK